MNYLVLIPLLIQLISAVEQLMPNAAGSAKFNAVIAAIEQVFGSVASQLPALQAIATSVVNAYNATGVFKKVTAPSAASVATAGAVLSVVASAGAPVVAAQPSLA
jgi:hypothetical protein